MVREGPAYIPLLEQLPNRQQAREAKAEETRSLFPFSALFVKMAVHLDDFRGYQGRLAQAA